MIFPTFHPGLLFLGAGDPMSDSVILSVGL